MEKIRIIIEVDIETNKTLEEVQRALTRGIYRGLDTEPYNVAPPANVDIKSIKER